MAVARALRHMFAGGVAIAFANFAMQIWFARTLGLQVIGDYAYVAVFLAGVGVATSLGVNQAVIAIGFTVHRQRCALAIGLMQAGVFLLASAMGAGLATFALPGVVERLWRPGLLTAIGMAAMYPAHAITCGFESRLEYGRLATARTAAFYLANVIALGFSLSHPSVSIITGRDAINGVGYLVFSLAMSRAIIVPAFDLSQIRSLLKISRSLWLNNMSTEGIRRLDFALAGLLLAPSNFGIYFQTRNLVDSSVGFFTYPIQSVVFSYFSTLKGLDNELWRRRTLFGTAAIALVSMTCAAVFGEKVIVLLFGPTWRPGGALLLPLALYATIVLYFELHVALAKAQTRMQWVLLARAINAAGILLFVPALTLRLGALGALWGTAAGSVLLLLAVELSAQLRSVAKNRARL